MTRLHHVLTSLLLCGALLTGVAPLRAQGLSPSAEQIYADASAKESAVRKALAGSNPPITVLRAVRTVVLDFESVAKRYPASPYSDDALWRAALLSSDAYRAFRDPREQQAATKLLQLLAAQYPTSKLAKQGPALIAELSMIPAKASVTFEPTDAKAIANPPVLMPKPAAPAAVVAKATETAPPTATPQAPKNGKRTLAADSTPPADAKPAVQASSVTARRVAANGIATINDIRRVTLSDVVRVIIELDKEVTFRDERLNNPDRVFLDLPATTTNKALRDQTLRFDGDVDPVRQIRLGRHPNNTTRVVLETGAISSYSVYALYNPFRLVIDCLREKPVQLLAAAPMVPPAPSVSPSATVNAPADSAVNVATTGVGAAPKAADMIAKPADVVAKAATTPAALPPFPTAPMPKPVLPLSTRRVEPWARMTPNVTSANAGVIAAMLMEPAPEPPPALPVAAVVPALRTTPIETPSRTLAGGFSLARQLGMSVSRIVIDPGHGGHDPGAKSNGTNEADLVLDVALRLEKLFQSSPGTEVILTRRTDEYLTLQERTALANREGADLFLSIHANASNASSARGVETYFLNFANNLTAAATAARENAAAGQSMGELPDVVKTIALNNKLDESRDFATYVQREMVSRLGTSGRAVRDLGVKQAPFQVLIGAAMPSILAEVAFLTNSQDAKLVKQPAYRQKIAEALFAAVRRYQNSLNHASAIAQQ